MGKATSRLRRLNLFGDRIQTSIFDADGAAPASENGVDWSVLRHPIRFLKEELSAPETQGSLFHYIRDEKTRHLHWSDVMGAIAPGQSPPSASHIFPDSDWQDLDAAEFQFRRLKARLASAAIHIAALVTAIALIRQLSPAPPPQENRVYVNTSPVYFPFESTGPDGGGGGGGGKREQLPASGGRMPDTSRVQLVAPDPTEPQPLIPAEDMMTAAPTVQMPIDIPQDQTLAIGDISAPPNDFRSSGPGSGGGMGAGTGTGVGSGSGPGVGPGSGGGMGGGSGGGIGSGVGPYVVGGGVSPPVPIAQPLPLYTEEARKARVEGIVLVQAVVRKDGTVDSFKVIRGLGYGLDESAIQTIANKWRFRPGRLNGAPVDVQANIEVSFRLY